MLLELTKNEKRSIMHPVRARNIALGGRLVCYNEKLLGGIHIRLWRRIRRIYSIHPWLGDSILKPEAIIKNVSQPMSAVELRDAVLLFFATIIGPGPADNLGICRRGIFNSFAVLQKRLNLCQAFLDHLWRAPANLEKSMNFGRLKGSIPLVGSRVFQQDAYILRRHSGSECRVCGIDILQIQDFRRTSLNPGQVSIQ